MQEPKQTLQMLKLITAYLVAVFLSWVTLVGVFLTLASIVFVVVVIPAEHQSPWFVVIAIICLIAAPCHAWVKEHLRAEKLSSPEAIAELEMRVETHKEQDHHASDAFKTGK
jgi:type VI protein secretion system component VasK